MATLNTYITQCQRLLHDANQSFYTTAELTDYINAARSKIASVTGCQRFLDTSVSVAAGTESYPFSGFAHPSNVIDVLGVVLIYGNERVSLQFKPWTEFTAYLRPWVQFQQRPMAWTKYGSTTIYLGPKPDQTYTTEIDTIEVPNTLIDNTTVEQLIFPFTDPIPYYACYLAKYKDQAYAEANIFLGEFLRKVREAVASSQMRRIRDIYDRETL